MALREVFARFSFAFDGATKLGQAEKGVDRIATKARGADESFASLAAGVASAFAGSALLGGLNHFAEQLDVLDDLSAQTKIATDDLQVYGFAAQKSGSSVEEMNASLGLLQKSLGKTTEATGTQVEALNKLKIDTSQPRALAEVLPEIFANFSQLETEAEKASVATSLFGRAGVRLIPTLERGAEGIADLRAELEASGGLVSAETIQQAGEYRDNLARLDRSFFALKGTLAGAVFPQLSKVVEAIAKGVGKLSDFAKSTSLAENAGLALAASLAGPLMGALRPFIGKGLKFAAIFAAVDEVLGFLQGKDSLIADFLDGAFGAGTADAVRNWANDAIEQIGYVTSSAQNANAVMLSDASSTWQKMLAAAVLGLKDIVSGFPGVRASLALTWAGIADDFANMILAIEIRWNQFLAKLSIPDSVKEFLKFDTKDEFKRTKETGAAKEEAQMRVVAAANRIPVEEQRKRFAAGDFAVGSPGEATPTQHFGGLGTGPAPETRAQRVNRERAEALTQQGTLAAPQVTATLSEAAKLGTTAILNDNKTVNLTFGSGVKSNADKEAIKAAVAEALRTDNRAALEALTQAAGKK